MHIYYLDLPFLSLFENVSLLYPKLEHTNYYKSWNWIITLHPPVITQKYDALVVVAYIYNLVASLSIYDNYNHFLVNFCNLKFRPERKFSLSDTAM